MNPTSTTRRWRRPVLAVLVAAGLALAAAGCASSSADEADRAPAGGAASPTTAAAPRPTADVDRQVRVDGGDLHLACEGDGSHTVVLVAGFTAGGDSWDPIVPDVARDARVCTYDRFGTGSSDPAPGPQTFATQASDLHDLLEVADEPGPYVVVGHSFGGLVAAAFTSQHPDEVSGLLLLDASPTDWNRTACSVPDLGTAATDTWVTTCDTQSGPSQNPEGLDGPAAFAAAAQIEDLGSTPLIVDQAADEGYGAMGLPADIATRLTETWDAGQQRWASMSSNGHLRRVPGTTHYIHVGAPAVVLAQIEDLLGTR